MTTLNQESSVAHGTVDKGVIKTSKGEKIIVEFEPGEGPKKWKNSYRCLGPLFGGWIGQKTGQWHWIYWVLFCFCFGAFVLAFFTPETLKVVLLPKQARRIREEHNSDEYIAKARPGSGQRNDDDRALEAIHLDVGKYHRALLFLLELHLRAAILDLFCVSNSIQREARMERRDDWGIVPIHLHWDLPYESRQLVAKTLYARHAAKHGLIPEGRLYPMMIGAITLPISFLILAFTSYPGIIWVGPAAAGVIFGFSMVTIYVAGDSYSVDSYSHIAASTISSKNLMRCLIAESVPLWINQLLHNVEFQFGCLLLACIAVAIAPMPFYLFFRGDRVRARAKRALKVERKAVKAGGEVYEGLMICR
ncbi:hypothetical protein IAR50_007258 [Cryptococcus sp. DSM 104548]